MIDRLHAWLQLPMKIFLWAAMLAGALMMLHVTADVLGRAIFNHPIAGTTEFVSGYYMIAVAFLPWTWVAATEGHIRVELFTRNLSAHKTAWLDAVVTLLTAAYVSIFTWQTFVRALQATRAGEAWEAPNGLLLVWPSRWMLPLAGALMVVYLVLRALADFVRLSRRSQESSG